MRRWRWALEDDTDVKAWIAIGASIALVGVSVVASYWINVNRFSLHAVYRNRLIRAFLGAARARQRETAKTRSNPDPFTGIDQADNLPLKSIWPPAGNGGRCLFHVVNTALNVVASKNLAWQERKAEPFVMTPLACGNPYVGFVPTRFFGARRDGITLGTAMAISGAAVSPNQGYHSSPIIGLLLMLFNVRLGWWLGNPRSGPKFYRREGPLLSIRPVLDELAGRTTDTGNYIYLSDGGHFDNLGLYEMVRRRCRFILVSDAGSDPAGAFEDLGNAVRKIWIDLGVRIEFDRIDVEPRQKPPVDGVYCALGRIRYPEAPETKAGTLIYVKPGFHGSEPPDIRAYAALHEEFPHESTADQWFSEFQMESYRGLGSHIIGKMCGREKRPARHQGAHPLGDRLSRNHAAPAPGRVGCRRSAPGRGARPRRRRAPAALSAPLTTASRAGSGRRRCRAGSACRRSSGRRRRISAGRDRGRSRRGGSRLPDRSGRRRTAPRP